MASVPIKTAQTYLSQYQTLLDKARRFNDTELDANQDPKEVFIKQEVPVMLSKAVVTLQANLSTDSVRASYEVPVPTNLPNSSLAFRREGDLLWVEENALPSQRQEGKQRQFSIHMQTQEVDNESTSVLPPIASQTQTNKELLLELSNVGKLLQPVGWLVNSSWR